MSDGIDIIIPIYNAYDDLKICLDSVYKYTDLDKNRLILINDNSFDGRIKSYLDSQQKENIIVIHNGENKGFSNNINIGMVQSEDRDVILLNSDTVVTKNWVEKIVKCAYSDSSIGTVTPLSNNATLCSVPNFCEENTLPEGMTIDQAAAIVEECSLKKYPRITVANGFCMFVKREVINTIGNFDAETFGRGYGEENDFCNRAEQMGYIHVMCDDTYIYHSGTKSFVSKEKEAYIKEHEQILYKRYPLQMQKNAEHCRDNPNGWVGENIGMYFDIWNGRKNVLYLLQSDFRECAEDNIGGTQIHVKHLTYGLRDTMNIFVVARNGEYLCVTGYTKNKEYIFKFYIGKQEIFPLLRSRKLAEIFKTILEGFKIDLVHVHHTITTSLDIYYQANKLGIPVIFTAHDYYCICPNEKLLDDEDNVCVGKEKDLCKSCLKKKKSIYEKNNYLKMWRQAYKEVFYMCKYIIAPSESAKEILMQYYSEYESKIKVIEHGIDVQGILKIKESDINKSEDIVWHIDKIDINGRCPCIQGVAYMKAEQNIRRKVVLKISDKVGHIIYLPVNFGQIYDSITNSTEFFAYIPNQMLSDGTLTVMLILVKNSKYYSDFRTEIISNVVFSKRSDFKVAFIGGINAEKGGSIITETIKRGKSEIEWYVFGGIGDKDLFNLQRKNLIKTNYYYPEDIGTLLKLHLIDVVCILSRWPETFSYTLSEAVINQCPVIVTDIGALGERTKKNKYGYAVKLESANKTAENVNMVIEKWRMQKNLYKKIKADMSICRHKNINTMYAEYVELYKLLFVGNKINKSSVETIESLNDANITGYGNKAEIEILKLKCEALENRIRKIDNNATIKIMLKLTEKEFPLKKQIKRMIMRHM